MQVCISRLSFWWRRTVHSCSCLNPNFRFELLRKCLVWCRRQFRFEKYSVFISHHFMSSKVRLLGRRRENSAIKCSWKRKDSEMWQTRFPVLYHQVEETDDANQSLVRIRHTRDFYTISRRQFENHLASTVACHGQPTNNSVCRPSQTSWVATHRPGRNGILWLEFEARTSNFVSWCSRSRPLPRLRCHAPQVQINWF